MVCLDCLKNFLYAARTTTGMTAGGTSTETELHVCPFCHSLNIDEYIAPQPEITSVKSVDLAEVDAMLKQGYIVKELYAKTATLIKKAEPKGDHIDDIIALTQMEAQGK